MLLGQPQRVFHGERFKSLRPDAVRTPACAFDPLIAHQHGQSVRKAPGMQPAADSGHQRRPGHRPLPELEKDLRHQLGWRGLHHDVPSSNELVRCL
jgi:hypothetical protein